MSLCPTEQGRASVVARRNICQPFEAHPRLPQPQYHHQTLGLRITLPFTQQPEARTERAEPQRSNGTRHRRGLSYDDEYAFLGDDHEEGYGSESDMDDEEDATSSISSGRDSMFYGGSSGSGSEEGDELQHQQLGESVPGIGSFYVRRDQVLRRRRRDFVKLKRSQKAKIVKTAYSVIEAVCETFFPGERMELLDAITGAHKTYRRRHQNNLLTGSTPNDTLSTTSSTGSSSSATPMVWDKKQQNASPPCTPPAPAILRAPGTRRRRASSLSMAPAEETRNPDPDASSFSSSTPMDRTMTRSAATAAGNTTSSSGWHRQAGGWGGFPSSSSSSSSASFGRPFDLVRGQGREGGREGGMMKKSSSTSSFPSFRSASAPSPSTSSSSMFSPSQEPIQSMQSYIMPPVHVAAAGATAAGRTSVPPSSASWSTSRTAVFPLPVSSSLPSSSSPRLGGKGGAGEQEGGGVPEEAWILHGLRFAAGGIIEC